MPVTKTAKRALRGSLRKAQVNKTTNTNLEAAIRVAKRGKKRTGVVRAMSLADRAAKKKFIHKNKASRIKSAMSKLLPKKTSSKKSSK